jgi:hypothetical protein
MNLEQIVKETVAKIVAEKQGKDLTGDGKIDSKDYLKARSMAIDKAKKLAEGDPEYDDMDISNLRSVTIKVRKATDEQLYDLWDFLKDSKWPDSPNHAATKKLVRLELQKRGLKYRYDESQKLAEASIPSNVESLANKIISWYEKHPNPKMQADRLPAVEKNIEYLMSKTVGNNAWDFKTFEKTVKSKYPLVFKVSQEINEDYEVSMAQSSLNSILRSAMELKAKIGNNEIDIPAWIQDHITNSENFIDQASQGYHEYHNGGEHGEMDEAIVSSDNVVDHLANALEYIWAAGKGNNPINFQDMAQSLYSDMFGGEEMNESTQSENLTINGKKVKNYSQEGDKSYTVDFEDGTTANFKVSNDNWDIINNNKSQELDEWTVSRLQHYAGIK